MKKQIVCLLSFITLLALGGSRADPLKFIDPDKAAGASLAVMVEDVPLAHTEQVFSTDKKGNFVDAGDVRRQTDNIIANLDRILIPVNSGLPVIAKLNVYLSRDADLSVVRRVLADRFNGGYKPAICFVTGALALPQALVAMDAVAATVPAVAGNLSPQSAVTAPIAEERFQVRKYPHVAVLPAGPKLYVSGMADTNSLLPATRATLEKLVACIGHLGSKPEDIVQLKVFLQPMSEVAAVRKVVADYFGGKAPPTVFVDWISASPVVEIEMIAAAHGETSKETNSVSYFTPPGTTDSKVYRRVARVNHGRLVYVSGLYGEKASDGAGQIREIFSKLGTATKQSGSDFEHLVKATYYVTDNDASDKLNALRPEYYNPQRPPAASKAKVKGVGLAGKTVTIDMIAVTK